MCAALSTDENDFSPISRYPDKGYLPWYKQLQQDEEIVSFILYCSL